MISKIKWKLTATYLTVIFVSMTVVGLYLSYSIEKHYTDELHQGLRSHLQFATGLLGSHLIESPDQQAIDAVCADLAQKVKARIQVVGLDGSILGDSEAFSAVTEPLTSDGGLMRETSGCQLCHSEVRKSEDFTETGDVVVNGEKIAEIRASVSMFGVKRATERARRIILTGLIITTLVAAIISHRLAGSIADPVSKMNRMAREIADGDLNQQVDIHSNDEVGQFGQSFNMMAERLRQMMSSMAEDRDKMQTVLTTMVDGIIVADENGVVVLFNNSAQGILKMQAEQVVGLPIDQTPLHPSLVSMVRDSLEKQNLVRKQLRLQDPAGVILSAYSAPIRDSSDQTRGVVVGLRDVTERSRQEKAQREFVANVSHELRTPITAVRVTAEALLSGAKDDPELLDRFLKSLVKESERLSLLIDDLLEIAKHDADQRAASRGRTSVTDVIDHAVAHLESNANDQNICVTVEREGDLFAYANADQVEQVLINLLDNAIKYTHSGGSVTVSAREDGHWISISVSDTGIGIPEEEISRIFERFYRVDKARSRQLGGTGLGLSIVRDIVTAHGGEVTVKSQLDKGSVFSFTIPKWRQELADG